VNNWPVIKYKGKKNIICVGIFRKGYEYIKFKNAHNSFKNFNIPKRYRTNTVIITVVMVKFDSRSMLSNVNANNKNNSPCRTNVRVPKMVTTHTDAGAVSR